MWWWKSATYKAWARLVSEREQYAIRSLLGEVRGPGLATGRLRLPEPDPFLVGLRESRIGDYPDLHARSERAYRLLRRHAGATWAV